MLIYFKTKNFSCFKDEAKISLKPGRVSERFEDNVTIVNKNLKLSKISVIAGENAGGKTSFILALDFLRNMIKGNIGRALSVFSYNFDNKIPQEFEICVAIEDIIYTYFVKVDNFSVIEENLNIRKVNQNEKYNKKVFSKKRISIETKKEGKISVITATSEEYANISYIPKEYNEIKSKFNNNSKLLINVFDALNVEVVKPFVSWIRNKLIIDIPKNYHLSKFEELEENEYNLEIILNDSFLDIFRLVDQSIINIKVDEKEPFKDTIIIRERFDGSTLETKLEDDSTGVRDFFKKSILIWKVINRDVTLFADEMDKVLNVVLASKILSYIKGTEHKGQFIFSTHNAFHLNTIDFMKEQIFFIDKNIDTLSSEIYSLGDFKEYRYSQPDVYNLYLRGLFGAVTK